MQDDELERDLRNAIRAHEVEYGVFQEGDTVRDREGGTWQLRNGQLLRVHAMNGAAP